MNVSYEQLTQRRREIQARRVIEDEELSAATFEECVVPLRNKKGDDLWAFEQEHQKQIQKIKTNGLVQVEDLKNRHTRELKELRKHHLEEITVAESTVADEINDAKVDFKTHCSKLKAKLAADIKALREEYEAKLKNRNERREIEDQRFMSALFSQCKSDAARLPQATLNNATTVQALPARSDAIIPRVSSEGLDTHTGFMMDVENISTPDMMDTIFSMPGSPSSGQVKSRLISKSYSTSNCEAEVTERKFPPCSASVDAITPSHEGGTRPRNAIRPHVSMIQGNSTINSPAMDVAESNNTITRPSTPASSINGKKRPVAASPRSTVSNVSDRRISERKKTRGMQNIQPQYDELPVNDPYIFELSRITYVENGNNSPIPWRDSKNKTIDFCLHYDPDKQIFEPFQGLYNISKQEKWHVLDESYNRNAVYNKANASLTVWRQDGDRLEIQLKNLLHFDFFMDCFRGGFQDRMRLIEESP